MWAAASIVMIFAVLCLTVFSSLSFVTANHERKLAEKSAAVIQQYYQADWNCEVMYEQIYQHLQKGGAPEQLSCIGCAGGAAGCVVLCHLHRRYQ